MSKSSLPTPAEILQRFYHAETLYMAVPSGERDFSGMAATLAPELKLYQSPDLPYGGTYDGHAGFQKWVDIMASHFDKLEVTDPEVFEKAGSDSVVVMSILKLRVRSTGEPLEFPMAQAIKVDRGRGLITEFRPFYWETQKVNKAIGK